MRGTLIAAVCLALLISFAGIGSHTLWTPDEPRDAAVGVEMLRTGDWIVPRLGGVPFLEKPPLYWWAQVASYRLFGVSDTVARVPSALAGALSLLVAFALGARLGGLRAGLLAAAALGTTLEFAEVMHRALVDPPLVLFVGLVHLGAVHWLWPRAPRDRALGAILIALGVPLAFLAKGVVGPALALGPPILYLALTRQVRPLLETWPVVLATLLGCAALVTPWALALHRTGGADALRETLIVNTVGRFGGTTERQFGHSNEWYYYLLNGPGHLAPWVIAIPAMLRAGVLRRTEGEDAPPRALLFASFALGMALLSLASGKRGIYLVPLFPAFAATVGWWLATAGTSTADEGRAWDRPTLLALLAGVAILPLAALGAAIVVKAVPIGGIDRARLSVLEVGPLAAFGGVAAIWAGAFGRILVRTVRERGVPRPEVVGGAIVVLMIAAQTVGKTAIDPIKDLHPVTAAMSEVFPPDADIFVFRPDETIHGIVSFDLGRTVIGRRDDEASDLLRQLEGRPGQRVAWDERDNKRLTPELKAGLRILRSGVGPSSRPYSFAEWQGPAAKPP